MELISLGGEPIMTSPRFSVQLGSFEDGYRRKGLGEDGDEVEIY